MSYFSEASVTRRAGASYSTPHLKRDVGFGEAYRAQRLNTYGMLEEGKIKASASQELGNWVSSVAGNRFSRVEGGVASPEFTNNAFEAMKVLQNEGAEVPDQFRFENEQDFHSDAIRREAEKYRDRQSVLDRATGAGKFGAFLGGVAGSMDDLENVATLPLGATGRMGIAMTALVEGSVNAAIEGAAHYPRQNLFEKMGIESGETFLGSVATGFVGGAVFGGAVRTITGSEIYKLSGQAIRGVGLKRAARVLQASDEPAVKVHGHAISDELAAREIDARRFKDASLQEDSDFLDQVTGGFEGRIRAAESAANQGVLPVMVRTSDEMVHQVEVSADIVRASDLLQRFDVGEALPLSEAEALGISVNATQRNVIEYYDLMDARFRGQEIPDEFDPIERATRGAEAPRNSERPKASSSDEFTLARSQVAAERASRSQEIKKNFEKPLDIEFEIPEIPAFAARQDTAEDFGEDLTRLAREDAQRERILNEYAGVDRVAVSTEDGGTKTMSVRDLLEQIEADEDFAEQIKLCGLH